MKMFKRICALVLAATLMLALVSCGEQTEKDVYTVGISQIVAHSALDAATEGFQQALKDILGEDKVVFNVQNAANSPDTCATIANTFVNQKVDLIMANGTPALQAAANATMDIPVLGTSITAYTVALGLDEETFTGVVGGNISGASDLAPLDQQAQMIIDLVPSAKIVGLLYCSAEPNSTYQVAQVKKYLEAKNLTVKEYAFAGSEDVVTITQKAATECDALYVPTDNTAASCAQTIYGAMTEKKPLIAGEAGICSGCGIATLSISYYDLGYLTGEMAAKILKGEADISEMEIGYVDTFTKKYNKSICDDLGIDTAELEKQGYVAIQ